MQSIYTHTRNLRSNIRLSVFDTGLIHVHQKYLFDFTQYAYNDAIIISTFSGNSTLSCPSLKSKKRDPIFFNR